MEGQSLSLSSSLSNPRVSNKQTNNNTEKLSMKELSLLSSSSAHLLSSSRDETVITTATTNTDASFSPPISTVTRPTPPPVPVATNYSTLRSHRDLRSQQDDDTREWTLINANTITNNNTYGSYTNVSDEQYDTIHQHKKRADSFCSFASSITDTDDILTSRIPTTSTYKHGGAGGANVGVCNVPVSYYSSEYILPPSRLRSKTTGSDSTSSSFSYTMMSANNNNYNGNGNDCYSSSLSVTSHSSLRGREYTLIEHIILPKDTLQGICIQYKVSPTRLRQVNQFSGSNLFSAPKRLLIPIKDYCHDGSGDCTVKGIKLQDTTTEEYRIHKVLSECGNVGKKEIQAYLELYDGDVHKSINAAKADMEWEKFQSNSIEESKLSIEPPSTSYYHHIAKVNAETTDVNINLRLTHEKNYDDDGTGVCENLLELKAVKDEAERWEELSQTNSYKSCIDNSQPLPMLVVGMSDSGNKSKSHKNINNTACAEDYYKAPPIDYGIEMKEFNSILSHPAIVTVPVPR